MLLIVTKLSSAFSLEKQNDHAPGNPSLPSKRQRIGQFGLMNFSFRRSELQSFHILHSLHASFLLSIVEQGHVLDLQESVTLNKLRLLDLSTECASQVRQLLLILFQVSE